jgi:hypothetical protein
MIGCLVGATGTIYFSFSPFRNLSPSPSIPPSPPLSALIFSFPYFVSLSSIVLSYFVAMALSKSISISFTCGLLKRLCLTPVSGFIYIFRAFSSYYFVLLYFLDNGSFIIKRYTVFTHQGRIRGGHDSERT